jgi:hypothetical protein
MQFKKLNVKFNYYLKIWQVFFDHLTMSLYSYKFYQKVYKNFNGYGIKHLLVCCALASVINCIWLFNQCDDLLGYLKNRKHIAYATYLDAIFNELPKLKYDGSHISSEEINNDSIFYIKNPKTQGIPNLVSINLSGKNNTTPKQSVINLTKNKLIINNKSSNVIDVPYTAITNNAITIDGRKLKRIITNYVENIRHLFLYKTLPGVFLFNLYKVILQNFFILICNALIVKFIFKKNISNGIRLATFAVSGLVVVKSLLQPFLYSTSFIDYYSTITMLLASIAMITNEGKIPPK